jgi:3',5'-cyclic AMP phosphodiesterase CpdA
VSSFVLAHASDLHVPSPWPLARVAAHPKRVMCALHHLMLRHGAHPPEVVDSLVRDLAEAGADHVALTGDFTVLSFESELAIARAAITPLIERAGAAHVSAIPGNHDRFTTASVPLFERHFGELATSDLDTGDRWPFVRIREGVAIVGLDSAVPTPLGFGKGRVGPAQRTRLEEVLARPEVREARFRVALVHHGPLSPQGGRDDYFRRLEDDLEVLDVCGRGRVDLLLHGHIHCAYAFEVERAGHRFATVGVGSSTLARGLAATFNLYTIEGSKLTKVEARAWRPESGRFDAPREVKLRLATGLPPERASC